VFNSGGGFTSSESTYEITGTTEDGLSPVKEDKIATKNKIGNFAIILILSVLIILALSDNFSVKSRKNRTNKSVDSKKKLRLKFLVYKAFIAYLNSIAFRKQSVDLSNLTTPELSNFLVAKINELNDSKIKIIIRDIEVDKIHIDNFTNTQDINSEGFTAHISSRIIIYKVKETTGEVLDNIEKKRLKINAFCHFSLQKNELKMSEISFNPDIF
jgi:hypothetical protein